MQATLTLTQAGERLGVDEDALGRLIRQGMLPEARQIRTANKQSEWVIPTSELDSIASRHGWTIDLRTSAEPAATEASTRYVKAAPQSVNASEEPGTSDVLVASSSEPQETSEASSTEIVVAQTAQVMPSVSDVIDIELLDRLLGAQEERAVARAEVEHTKSTLENLNASYTKVTSELEVERRERMMAAERYREERLARAQSEAKVAELRDRVAREMALAEAERAARQAALHQMSQVERDAANAHAAMTRRSRRRYRRISG